MAEKPCPSTCNSRARKAWKQYEADVSQWRKDLDAYAIAQHTAEGDAPTLPDEPDIRVVMGDPVFCRRCASAVTSALGELDHLAGLLQADIDGMRGLPSMEKETTGKRGKASVAESVDPRVDDLDELYRMLTAAEDWWREVRGYGARPYVGEVGEQPLHAGSHPRSRTLGWLGDHVGDILQHPDCAKFGLGVLAWQRRLQVDTKATPEPTRRAAHCPRCHRRSLWGRDDKNVECRNPDCRRVMDADEYDEVREADLERGGKPADHDMQEAS